jgi:hypothetical protein
MTDAQQQVLRIRQHAVTFFFWEGGLEIRKPPLPLLHVYVVIWLKMIGDVQEKVVVFVCV